MSTAVSDTQPWVRRVPAPLFVAVYGALVILVIFGVAMAASRTTASTPEDAELPQPERPFNPAPADPGNVAASIRPNLIDNVRVGETNSGAMMRGDVVVGALDDSTEIAGHLSRLLEQNCLDTVTLTSKSGMRFNFWGFCFSTLPPETLAQYIDFGVAEGADSVSFVDYASHNHFRVITLNWMDVDDADALSKRWLDVERPDEIDRVTFNGYTDDEVVVVDNDKETGEHLKRWPLLANPVTNAGE